MIQTQIFTESGTSFSFLLWSYWEWLYLLIRTLQNKHIRHTTTSIATPTSKLKKQTTFNNTRYTINISTNPDTITEQDINIDLTTIHTTIATIHLAK